MADGRRIVKVYVVDPNIDVPLEKAIIYEGSEKLTEATDQELFFEVPMKDLLDKHNAVRIETVNKKASEKFGREIKLEPARVRDLRMLVVNVAQF